LLFARHSREGGNPVLDLGLVIPAALNSGAGQAGIQFFLGFYLQSGASTPPAEEWKLCSTRRSKWIPACAGMTSIGNDEQ
jgi:hypothetical protein